jgi:outer membrane protein TolC
MQLTRLLTLLASGILAAGPALGAKGSAATTHKVQLIDCIRLALENNLDVRISRQGPETARYNLNSSYGYYDPLLGFALGGNSRDQSAGTDAQGRTFGSRQIETLFFGRDGSFLQGNLPFGGLRYGVGFTMSRSVSDPPFVSFLDPDGGLIAAFDTQYGASLMLAEIRQPLLRDFWVDQARLNIQVNKENLKGSEVDLRLQIMNTLLQVEQAYYELIYAREFIQVQQTALDAAERLLAENRKRVEVGAMAPLEEKSAEAQAAASRAALIAAHGDYGTRQRALKSLISDDYSPIRELELEPVEELTAIPTSFQVQDSWLKGLTLRPDLERWRILLRQRDLEIRFQKNQLYPVLDLVGSYGQSANNFSGLSDAFSDIGEGRYPSYGLRLEFSIPLGNTTARNTLRARRSELERALLEYKKVEQTVMIEIDNAIAVARTSFERAGATRESSAFAKAAWEAEQIKLDNGKSTSYEVLLRQRDYIRALSEEKRALADYNRALADLSYREGDILGRHQLGFEVR